MERQTSPVAHEIFTRECKGSVAEKVGPASRFIHFGLTSTDVVDTAQALQIREASQLIEAGLVELLSILKSQALRYKDLPMIGRTHGIHAEPVTFGLKLANHYAALERQRERLVRALDARGSLLGIGRWAGEGATLQPVRVFRQQEN